MSDFSKQKQSKIKQEGKVGLQFLLTLLDVKIKHNPKQKNKLQ
jgi:hypothetical protein